MPMTQVTTRGNKYIFNQKKNADFKLFKICCRLTTADVTGKDSNTVQAIVRRVGMLNGFAHPW